jgi:hypothetical protein
MSETPGRHREADEETERLVTALNGLSSGDPLVTPAFLEALYEQGPRAAALEHATHVLARAGTVLGETSVTDLLLVAHWIETGTDLPLSTQRPWAPGGDA